MADEIGGAEGEVIERGLLKGSDAASRLNTRSALALGVLILSLAAFLASFIYHVLR